MLQDGGIYFAAASTFKDGNEGRFLEEKYIERANWLGYGVAKPSDYIPDVLAVEEDERAKTYISCWFKGVNPTEFMWKSYAGSENGILGVAIKCNWFVIHEAIPPHLKEVVRSEDCRYREAQQSSEFSNLYAYKGEKYEPENECRFIFNSYELNYKTGINIDEVSPVVIDGEPPKHNNAPKNLVVKKGRGAVVSIDLSIIIEAIYIHHSAPIGHEDAVKAELERFGYAFQVIRSVENTNEVPKP